VKPSALAHVQLTKLCRMDNTISLENFVHGIGMHGEIQPPVKLLCLAGRPFQHLEYCSARPHQKRSMHGKICSAADPIFARVGQWGLACGRAAPSNLKS
jgi:hypothetical protein